MKRITKIMSLIMAVAVCFAFMPVDGISQDKDKEEKEEMMMKEQTIVQIASNSENLSTLVSAVKEAGLAETLSGEGPFTVFAPTNKAFEALPEGTLEKLMKPENKEKLRMILMNHVVSGVVMSGDLEDGQMVETMAGAEAEVSLDEAAMISNAAIEQADIEASNGVVHVINKVMVPSDKMKKDKMEEDNMEDDDGMEEEDGTEDSGENL